jgi:group I intron endonuclease
MKKSGIYKIINVINNKFYVGSAVDFRRRKRIHWWKLRRGDHVNKHLQAAWNKYGEKSFTFVIVEEHPEGADLLAAENVWLKEHVGKDYCYNVATDATAPTLGWYGEKNPMWGKTFKHTDAALEKIKRASTGRKHSKTTKRKIRAYLIGKPRTAEVRAKIAASVSGERNPNYGKPRDASFIEKVSRKVVAIKPDQTAKVYPSIKALREELNIKPPTINRALKSEKPLARGPYKGWIFKAVDTPSGPAYIDDTKTTNPSDSFLGADDMQTGG